MTTGETAASRTIFFINTSSSVMGGDSVDGVDALCSHTASRIGEGIDAIYVSLLIGVTYPAPALLLH